MSGEKTILGPTLEIEGEIEGSEDLVIQGKVNGRIVSKKSLTIDQTGDVNATVTTEGLAVSGKLNGNVEASDKVEIRREGTMIGDIKAPRVVIADGAKFKGRVEMGVD
ncbi:MAG TPA: polymer-forming cytoskeletal protein [Kofleriaceae bacterium]|jgi:cytoskeletal protein CcmA (bactofilin family)|nr:polymer-forming cytoskeletal protein [Kofleriaceae bacterium]